MRETTVTCNTCGEVIKIDRSGGRLPSYVVDIFWVPAPHFTVTNNKNEVFDFCSKKCIVDGDFE